MQHICYLATQIYSRILEIQDIVELTETETEILENIIRFIEHSYPIGKYTVQKLVYFKKIDDPTFKEQKQFFKETEDLYVNEFISELEKISSNKNVEVINNNEIFKEPVGYEQFDLVSHYKKIYTNVKILYDNNKHQKIEKLKNLIEITYERAFKMCKKLNEYMERYPQSDYSDMWNVVKTENFVNKIQRYKKNRRS